MSVIDVNELNTSSWQNKIHWPLVTKIDLVHRVIPPSECYNKRITSGLPVSLRYTV